MFSSVCRWLALALVGPLLVVTAAPAAPAGAAVASDYEFYARWGLSGLTDDRETNNRVLVHDIARIGDRVYVAGNFLDVVNRTHRDQPVSQSFLAAFDAASGDWIPSFRPVLNHPAYVVMRHPTTGAIVVGGEFTTVNGIARKGVVALDPDTGATDATFKTQVLGGEALGKRSMVKGLATDGQAIFIGGSFSGAGDGHAFAQHSLIKVGLDGTIDRGWVNNVTGGGIWDVVMSTDRQRVIAAGRFNAVNASPRAGLAMMAAADPGTLHPAFASWSTVGLYCYAGYPACLLNYDLDDDHGELAVAGAEHYVAVFDDTTGLRKWVVHEPNDTQAAMFQGGNLWLSRHGSAGSSGLWYARDRGTGALSVSTAAQTPSSGPGGFAYAPGDNGCVWFGGSLGALDLADVPGTGKVEANHLAFMCPARTPVPASSLNISNWQSDPALVVRHVLATTVAQRWVTVAYLPAPGAVLHRVIVDGRWLGVDGDGTFSVSGFLPGTTHQITVRAVSAGGASFDAKLTVTTGPASAPDPAAPADALPVS